MAAVNQALAELLAALAPGKKSDPPPAGYKSTKEHAKDFGISETTMKRHIDVGEQLGVFTRSDRQYKGSGRLPTWYFLYNPPKKKK